MATLVTLRRAAPLALSLLLTGCGVTQGVFGRDQSKLGEPAPMKPVVGFTVAPVPQAALAARQILNAGGNAADAATAAGFALAVALPSRAGLGGGAACLIDLPASDGGNGIPTALLFPPAAAPESSGGASRPAAVPQMARGLIAMQARFGRLALATDLAPAEAMAGGGVAVSRTFAADLAVVGNALLADSAARTIFASPTGQVLQPGMIMRQPDLAATLTQLQSSGVLGLTQGASATAFITAANQAGAGLTMQDLRAVRPAYASPITVNRFGYHLAFTPNAGGIGAAAGIEALAQNPQALDLAGQRALAAAQAARHGAALTALPASASFATLDDRGGAVGCATTMNNLFGTGRVAPGTGILLAATPAHITPPLLTVGLATRGGDFRAIATGSGQQGAAMAVATGLANAVRSAVPMPQQVPAPGRANVIACAGLLPGGPKTCAAAADPRGFGLAIGSK
ncbi:MULTISPECIES: gamma-glutamyltransferase [Acidiphilium]|uniref:Gamma-glutamyltranspeptidase / glutathione hydrolase n=1 Tax=Acidiphilium rubrum TaxID=526 RepID=A0A8G2FLE9_ACIRU|nr:MULTISPECIES: gamma-glutamyltransferase [Acidiphilium]SIQ78863.1 gamma-glutamyltranspeptidase / glutathione hydrolase [Acidiphilium rubrum]